MSIKNFVFGWLFAIRRLWNRKTREATMQQLQQMMKEGVDPLDSQERKGWIRSHRKEVRTAIGLIKPRIGRNAPCSCGSGKKYKKCCGGGQV